MGAKSSFSGGSGGMANNNHYDWRERNALRHSGDDETLTLQRYILSRWPSAVGIRLEAGRCPNCRRAGLFASFVQPSFDYLVPGTESRQTCGFVCAACGWSNAGARPVRSETERE